jgi:hypothetical protein
MAGRTESIGSGVGRLALAPRGVRASRARDAILWGGFSAGVLDIVDAFVMSAMAGVMPNRVLQAIASGLLGREAFQGGLATAALGLVLHFVIAFGAATTYYAASLKLPVLTRRWVICGLAFGLAVFFFMQHVVLPLSAFRISPNRSLFPVNGLLIHALGVGLPIAFFTWRSTRR